MEARGEVARCAAHPRITKRMGVTKILQPIASENHVLVQVSIKPLSQAFSNFIRAAKKDKSLICDVLKMIFLHLEALYACQSCLINRLIGFLFVRFHLTSSNLLFYFSTGERCQDSNDIYDKLI